MDPKEDATQTTGVSDETGTIKPDQAIEKDEKQDITTAEQEALDRQKSFLSRRNEEIDRIVEHRNEEFAKEVAASEPTQEEEKEPAKKEEKTPEKKEPASDEEDELIIEGEKQKIPKSKIYDTGKRALQKELAADKKLEEAGRKAKEIVDAAQVEAQKIRSQRPSEGDKPTDAHKDTTSPKDDLISDEKLTDWVSKIQYGSEDEGKQALKEILTQGRGTATTTQVKEEEVIEKVEQRLVIKGIREKFEKEFDDIVDDPELYEIARKRVGAALQGGKPNTWETYHEVGQSVREKFVKKVEKTEPGNKPDSLESRREKKRSLDTVKPASSRTTTVEAPVMNPDVSGTIQAMKSARVSQR
jgi:hypothetical protein